MHVPGLDERREEQREEERKVIWRGGENNDLKTGLAGCHCFQDGLHVKYTGTDAYFLGSLFEYVCTTLQHPDLTGSQVSKLSTFWGTVREH